MDPVNDQNSTSDPNNAPVPDVNQTVPSAANPVFQPAVEAVPVFPAPAQTPEPTKKPSNKRKWFLFGGIGAAVVALIVAALVYIPVMSINREDYVDMDANAAQFAGTLNAYFESNGKAIDLHSVRYSLTLDKQIEAAVAANLKDVEALQKSFDKLKTAESTAKIRADFTKRAIYDKFEAKMAEVVAYAGRFSHSLKPYIYAMRVLKTENFVKEDASSQIANVMNELQVIDDGIAALVKAAENGQLSNSGLTKEQGLKYFDNKYKTFIDAMKDLSDAGGEASKVGTIYYDLMTRARVIRGQLYEDTASIGIDAAKKNHTAALAESGKKTAAELEAYSAEYKKYTESTFDYTKEAEAFSAMLIENTK